MPEFEGRERFIPLRRQELIDWLSADDSLKADECDSFRLLCRWLAASLHFQFNRRFEELKTAYDPFDPDTDMQPLLRLKSDEKQRRLNSLYRDFVWLMDRANFVHLTCDDIEACLKETSAWGVPMRVDFGAFEHLAIFARGDVLLPRTRRRWRNFYRKEETKVASYQRLVMILKLKPGHGYGEDVNTECVYLKIFKDIPKLDIKMLLPTARVRFTNLDRGRIGLPLASGIAAALYNLGVDALEALNKLVGAWDNPLLLWGVAAGGVTYSYRSYYGYQQMKQRYHLTLTKSLYYQNLDSNAGVLYRLFDEAEEQECKEAILAYFLLWRHAGPKGWTAHDLNQFVEPFLESMAHVPVDFETPHALASLDKFGMIEKSNDRVQALPLSEALTRLEAAWGNCLRTERTPPSRPARIASATR
jgi:hypothetical protein